MPKMLRNREILDTIDRGVRDGVFLASLRRPDKSVRTWWRNPIDEAARVDPALELFLPHNPRAQAPHGSATPASRRSQGVPAWQLPTSNPTNSRIWWTHYRTWSRPRPTCRCGSTSHHAGRGRIRACRIGIFVERDSRGHTSRASVEGLRKPQRPRHASPWVAAALLPLDLPVKDIRREFEHSNDVPQHSGRYARLGPMVREWIVPHSAIDIRMNNHSMATFAAAAMDLEPTVMSLQRGDNFAILLGCHRPPSSRRPPERLPTGFRQQEVADPIVRQTCRFAIQEPAL